MGDLREYQDAPKEMGLSLDKPPQQKTPALCIRLPKTITELMIENNLSFPFIVKKISSYSIPMGGLCMSAGIHLTVSSRVSNIKWNMDDNKEKIYLCFIDQQSFQVLDSPAWMLIEKSDDNVLPLDAYRKFREAKKVRIR